MNDIQYKIVRSNRKSIALVIDGRANLVIRAPNNIKDSDISCLIAKKKRWIAEKQHKVSVFNEKHSPVIIETGESVLYIGNTYTIMKNSNPEVQFSSANILIPNEFSKADMVVWMKEEAKKILLERVNNYASLMGTNYSKLHLSDAKARWGSCSAKGNLNLSWRLVMCPMSVIDYVVVHELSHIEYKNHSSCFWARVKTVLPNYKEQQEWLRLNQNLMEII